MASFLEDISRFYGTGERNAAGQTLEEFLEEYNPYKYKTPSCTTDAVIFAYEEERCETIDNLKVLLVKRSNHPSIGYWALPGGFIDLNENLDATARRELEEETGVKGLVMEQVAVYGDYDRDPRARVITTAYMALVQKDAVKVQAGDDAADAVWCDISLEEVAGECTHMEEQDGVQRKEYRLTVSNAPRALRTCAYVEHTIVGELIREEKFAVTEQGQIAVDHSAIIVQALLKLRERLR